MSLSSPDESYSSGDPASSSSGAGEPDAGEPDAGEEAGGGGASSGGASSGGASSGGASSDEGLGRSSKDPYKKLKEEAQLRLRQRRLSEVRATRLTISVAERTDYMAEMLGIDVSTFIRLVLEGEIYSDQERADVSVLRASLRHVCALVREHELDMQERAACAGAASDLREAVEESTKKLL